MNQSEAKTYLALLAADPGLEIDTKSCIYFDQYPVEFTLSPQRLYWRHWLFQADGNTKTETIEPGEKLLEMLLEANSLGRGAAGAVFAMTEEGALMLRDQLLLDGLTDDILDETLQDFVNQIEFWQRQLTTLLVNQSAP